MDEAKYVRCKSNLRWCYIALTSSKKHSIDYPHYQYSDFSNISKLSFLKISVKAINPQAAERMASHLPMLSMLRFTGEDNYSNFADAVEHSVLADKLNGICKMFVFG